jgi:hypothetical protein
MMRHCPHLQLLFDGLQLSRSRRLLLDVLLHMLDVVQPILKARVGGICKLKV